MNGFDQTIGGLPLGLPLSRRCPDTRHCFWLCGCSRWECSTAGAIGEISGIGGIRPGKAFNPGDLLDAGQRVEHLHEMHGLSERGCRRSDKGNPHAENDRIVRQGEIDEDNINDEDNPEEFGPMKPDEEAYCREQAGLFRGSDRAVVTHLNGTCLGDITLGNLAKLREIAGDVIDVVCGTGFGTRESTFCSRSTNDGIHKNTSWKTFKYSCGAIESFLPDIIDSGFDIINPVQCSAKGMEAKILKERHGDRITFWGGGVNTQKAIPFGTPEEVRAEVLERCETSAHGGGFVFNAIHNVQTHTPTENVITMIEVVDSFNGGAA